MNPGARSRVAYILAPSHSGSTLLALLLASHPDVCTVGELNLAAIDDRERYLCSCRARLIDCPFWQAIAARMREGGVAFDVTRAGTDFRRVGSAYVDQVMRPLHRGAMGERVRDAALALSAAWRREYPAIQQRNGALVASVLAQTGAAVVVDSSKIGIRLKFLLRNPALDVRVIRLVRDGRAVALTYLDPARFADAGDPALRGGGTGGGRDHERLPITAAAREWRRSHEEADALLSGVPRRQWIQVHYETLCRATEQTLGTLFDFLGVDPTRPRPDFRTAGNHVIGNGMRLDTTSGVALDDRWASTLTAGQLRTFDAEAGSLNRRFGYAT